MFSTCDGSSSSQTFTVQISPQSGEIQFAPTPTHTKKINSFALWMEAWNVYAGTILATKPSRALEFFGYQRIITSLNLSLPSIAWITYDIKFWTLTASHPSLHWDIRHLDTWINCIHMPKAQPEWWPCPHCGNMYHFPDCRPFWLDTSSDPSIRQLPAASGAISTAPTVGAIANPTNATFNMPYQQSLPPICRDFNSHSCSRLNCVFHHVCKLCTGQHPKYIHVCFPKMHYLWIAF